MIEERYRGVPVTFADLVGSDEIAHHAAPESVGGRGHLNAFLWEPVAGRGLGPEAIVTNGPDGRRGNLDTGRRADRPATVPGRAG